MESHIVPNLQTKMLIGTDVMAPEGISLDFARREGAIASCQDLHFPINVNAKPRHQGLRPLLCTQRTVIPAFSEILVPVQTKTSLPDDRDYLLEPYDTGLTVYPSVMNSDSSRVPVKNSTARDIIIARKARLGNFMEISALTAYPLHIDGSGTSHTVPAPPTTSDPSIKPVSNPLRVETSTHNGVTIYGTGETACRLSAVVDEFDIWGEKPGFAEVPEDRWMEIPLKEGISKMYP